MRRIGNLFSGIGNAALYTLLYRKITFFTCSETVAFAILVIPPYAPCFTEKLPAPKRIALFGILTPSLAALLYRKITFSESASQNFAPFRAKVCRA